MIGVKFNEPMRPYGAGDVALLPEDVAQRLVDDGVAELHELPDSPHAHEAGFRPAVTKPMAPAPAAKPRQGYFTKGKR
jgi:hypothetical protein